jgi:hypothetical protein
MPKDEKTLCLKHLISLNCNLIKLLQTHETNFRKNV